MNGDDTLLPVRRPSTGLAHPAAQRLAARGAVISGVRCVVGVVLVVELRTRPARDGAVEAR